MSGNPTTPSNVVAMPTNWPGPMFTPKTFPPGGPSCFSELAALNACYDSIQMMNQILAKVITDLVTNDKAVQTAIVEAIAASGSNVPLIGVTNGSDAQPGQVGEFVQFYVPNVTFSNTTFQSQSLNLGVLQPGDWDCYAGFGTNGVTGGVQFFLQPLPPGFDNVMPGTTLVESTTTTNLSESAWTISMMGRALISAPTLVVFYLGTNLTSQTGGATTGNFLFEARRRR